LSDSDPDASAYRDGHAHGASANGDTHRNPGSDLNGAADRDPECNRYRIRDGKRDGFSYGERDGFSYSECDGDAKSRRRFAGY
jgi:hypothetical protein